MQETWVWSLVQEDSHDTRQLSLCATATEPDFLEPMFCGKRSHLNKKPKHSNTDSAQLKINKWVNKLKFLNDNNLNYLMI